MLINTENWLGPKFGSFKQVRLLQIKKTKKHSAFHAVLLEKIKAKSNKIKEYGFKKWECCEELFYIQIYAKKLLHGKSC